MKYLLLAFLLTAVPAVACVQSAQSTDTFVQVCTGTDACRTIFYDELQGGSVKRQEAQIQEALQAFLDTRLTLASFPAEDPDKASDPNCENNYWGDTEGTKKISLEATHLIARDCLIDDVSWDGTQFNLTIRRADRCQ